ncbi:MAG: DNA repair protein RecO [Casimicrobiaceae bacterium]
MKSPRRVSLSPAFVLHHYAYRDTSRIVEAFTAEHGRLSLFARGVTGPKSGLRAALRPFQRLLLSWSGKSDACQLQGAEVDGEPTTVPPARLMSGFYLNELLLKLTLRADPHARIFDGYGEAVRSLCSEVDEESVLRRFEKRLLDELGYGLQLANTDEGRRIEPTMYYRFTPQSGPQPCVADAPGAVYGQSLADLDAEVFSDARSLRDAKRLLRAAIDECLEGRTLMSRRIMLDLRRRERA